MEVNTPPFSYFCEHSTSLFQDMKEMLLYEQSIIKAYFSLFQYSHFSLRWDFGVITVAHYTELFESIGILFQDDSYRGNKIRDTTRRYVTEFLHFFLCLSVAAPAFSAFSPSIQLVAIVAAARRAAGVRWGRARRVRSSPEWREELEALLGRKKEDAEACLEVLWRVFKEKYPEQGAKSGKESPTNPYVAVCGVCSKQKEWERREGVGEEEKE